MGASRSVYDNHTTRCCRIRGRDGGGHSLIHARLRVEEPGWDAWEEWMFSNRLQSKTLNS